MRSILLRRHHLWRIWHVITMTLKKQSESTKDREATIEPARYRPEAVSVLGQHWINAPCSLGSHTQSLTSIMARREKRKKHEIWLYLLLLPLLSKWREQLQVSTLHLPALQCGMHWAVRSQMALTASFWSAMLLPFVFAMATASWLAQQNWRHLNISPCSVES